MSPESPDLKGGIFVLDRLKCYTRAWFCHVSYKPTQVGGCLFKLRSSFRKINFLGSTLDWGGAVGSQRRDTQANIHDKQDNMSVG